MSADSDIATLLSHATNAASSLAGNASALVNTAVSALESDVEFPDPPDFNPEEIGISFGGSDGVVPAEPPVAFPAWPNVDLGEAPNTQTIGEVELDIEDITFPTLTFPTFIYPTVAGVPSFSKQVPDVGTDPELPTIPSTDPIFVPNFLTLGTLDAVELSVSAPTFAPISTEISFDPTVFSSSLARFKSSIFGGNGNLPGLDDLLADLNSQTRAMVDAVLPAALDVLSARMNDKQAAVLAFQSELRNRLTGRLTDEKNRVISTLSDRSGWDLPHPVQIARKATVDQIADAWAAHAESQADAQASELALEFFETCGSLLADFATNIQKFKAQEITLILEAHKNALAYAKSTISALQTQYEAENFLKQNADYQKAEAQLKIFESELAVALLQYEVARANLQAEEAQQESDAARIQTLKAEVARDQNSIRRYAALVSAARNEVAFRRFSVERFELTVKAFGASVDAHEARVSALIAEIDGDAARVEGQLKVLQGFESKMRGFLRLIETKQAIVTAQSARNEAVIEEFQQRAKAALAFIDQSVLENAYALKKYETQIADLVTDAKLNREAAKLEFEFKRRKLDGELDATRLTQERNIKLLETELTRLKSIAEVNAQGASIMASMAQGAMSAANGIAAAIYSETA